MDIVPPSSMADKMADESGARPKVLRRPAQFSRHAAPAASLHVPPVIALPALITDNPPTPITGWQEDGRFGMLLIVVIGLLNLGLALLLQHTTVPRINELPTTSILSDSGAAMPSAVAKPSPDRATTYYEPKAGENPWMDIEELPEDYNRFDTSPTTMPVPTARDLQGSDR